MSDRELMILAEATIRILKAKADNKDNVYYIYMDFVKVLLKLLLLDSLSLKPPLMSRDKQLQKIKLQFATAKLGIQEAVAFAFQEALKEFSKTDVEYACTISPVTESNSKASH